MARRSAGGLTAEIFTQRTEREIRSLQISLSEEAEGESSATFLPRRSTEVTACAVKWTAPHE